MVGGGLRKCAEIWAQKEGCFRVDIMMLVETRTQRPFYHLRYIYEIFILFYLFYIIRQCYLGFFCLVYLYFYGSLISL